MQDKAEDGVEIASTRTAHVQHVKARGQFSSWILKQDSSSCLIQYHIMLVDIWRK